MIVMRLGHLNGMCCLYNSSTIGIAEELLRYKNIISLALEIVCALISALILAAISFQFKLLRETRLTEPPVLTPVNALMLGSLGV